MLQPILFTLLGFLFVQAMHVWMRDSSSESSPVKFDWGFFWKDNWKKILISLVISLSTSLTIHFGATIRASKPIDIDLGLIQLEVPPLVVFYLVIGAFPERILQFLKTKFGVFQKDNVKGYNRK